MGEPLDPTGWEFYCEDCETFREVQARCYVFHRVEDLVPGSTKGLRRLFPW
jgi:hypothetical protein